MRLPKWVRDLRWFVFGTLIALWIVLMFVVYVKGYDYIVDHSAPVIELRATVQAMQTEIANIK